MSLTVRSLWVRTVTIGLCVAAGVTWARRPVLAEPQDAGGKAAYDQIKGFALTGGTTTVEQMVLKRDRVTMTFTGSFYFAAPVAGKVTGAVFVGEGSLKADAPPSDFERDNLKRLIGAELVETDFKTAVLRFSDDTFDKISAGKHDGVATPQAQRLAAESEARYLRETGSNLSARIAVSQLNGEPGGIFVAQFDGGRRGRYAYVFDQQGRLPFAGFGLNGGEKGLIHKFDDATYINEIWMAFYALGDYEKKAVEYTDANSQVDIRHYKATVDLRNFSKAMGLSANLDMTTRSGDLRALSFRIGEGLGVFQEERLKNQLRLKAARFGGAAVPFAQEDWEGGFTVFLAQPIKSGQEVALEVDLEGDFIDGIPAVPEVFYLRSNDSWMPRHGDLDRATFDVTFRHRKQDRIASIGTRVVSDQPDPKDPAGLVTQYVMKEPVALTVFAIGPFERKVQTVTFEASGKPIPLEYSTVPQRVTRNFVAPYTGNRGITIRHEFILEELNNAVRYFAAYFGPYPYETFGAAFHPYNFGQGFPTMMMLPPVDEPNKHAHAFIAHETGHQWWGNIVAWRSYRDQWLSEGFAEYSGILYAGKRDREGPKAAADLIKEGREQLLNPPFTTTGTGRGRLNDIGPLVLGRRLFTSKTTNAYQALIYQKGALVLRMLHFLMSDPATMNDTGFVNMMKDFVEKHRNGAATTEQFAAVASQHFANTPIGRKFQLRDLNWFFNQWVYHTELPTYTLEYELKPNADGSQQVVGTVKQDNAGANWMMVLPVVFSFDGNQEARTTVRVQGASTPFELKLPAKPKKVELDPGSWILSEKTITKPK
jgi:hypothetical protein